MRSTVCSYPFSHMSDIVLYFLAVGGVRGFAFTLGLTTIIDVIVVFWFTHPMLTLLVRTKFFGGGHKLSGLDPVHLGQTVALARGRGAAAARQKRAKVAPSTSAPKAVPVSTGGRMTIAERRAAAAAAAKEAENDAAGAAAEDEADSSGQDARIEGGES